MGIGWSTPTENSNTPESVNADTKQKYGWVRDIPDHRDKYHQFMEKELPSLYTLDISKVPVYNQGHLGSCTANAIACAYQYDEIKQKEKDENTPSRLFIYYNERAMEGTVNSDSGAQIRDGIKTINQTGVCDESLWPYDITKFAEKPSENCYQAAENNKAVTYTRVLQTLSQLKLALDAGFPVVFGVSVYSSFESEKAAETGVIPLPQPDEKLLGGHAITMYGYDEENKQFLFRNSWGNEWGQNGDGRIPYDYVLNPDLAADFWTVTKIKEIDTQTNE